MSHTGTYPIVAIGLLCICSYMDVLVPAGCVPGQCVDVPAPDGTRRRVAIPAGYYAGATPGAAFAKYRVLSSIFSFFSAWTPSTVDLLTFVRHLLRCTGQSFRLNFRNAPLTPGTAPGLPTGNVQQPGYAQVQGYATYEKPQAQAYGAPAQAQYAKPMIPAYVQQPTAYGQPIQQTVYRQVR